MSRTQYSVLQGAIYCMVHTECDKETMAWEAVLSADTSNIGHSLGSKTLGGMTLMEFLWVFLFVMPKLIQPNN